MKCVPCFAFQRDPSLYQVWLGMFQLSTEDYVQAIQVEEMIMVSLIFRGGMFLTFEFLRRNILNLNNQNYFACCSKVTELMSIMSYHSVIKES